MGEVWVIFRSTLVNIRICIGIIMTYEFLWDLHVVSNFYWLWYNPFHSGVADKEHSEVLQVVESVKMQQRGVMEKLQLEQSQLEEELDDMALQEMVGSGTVSDIVTDTGIPDDAYTLECPDEHLKMTVLEEFLLLDKKYEAQLEYLSIKYQHAKQLVNTYMYIIYKI